MTAATKQLKNQTVLGKEAMKKLSRHLNEKEIQTLIKELSEKYSSDFPNALEILLQSIGNGVRLDYLKQVVRTPNFDTLIYKLKQDLLVQTWGRIDMSRENVTSYDMIYTRLDMLRSKIAKLYAT